MKFFEKLPEHAPVNQEPFDRFTFAHLGIGMWLGALRMTFPGIVTFAVGWEIVEQPLKKKYSKIFPVASQDTFANAATDALAVIAGWGLVKLYEKSIRGRP